MKKKIFGGITVLAIVAISTFNVNINLKNKLSFTDFTLAFAEVATADECKDKSDKGYGTYYALHEAGCTVQATLWPFNYKRGVKNICKLKKPCDSTASCSSTDEKACRESK